jgi:transcriptional regulator with XRE-family HTH domain
MDSGSVVAKRLMEARLRTGLSQKQLGIKAGIDEFSASPRINQYERGKHTPDYFTVERLAKVLKVPTPFLYAKDDELATFILLFGALSPKGRKQALKAFSSLIEQTGR